MKTLFRESEKILTQTLSAAKKLIASGLLAMALVPMVLPISDWALVAQNESGASNFEDQPSSEVTREEFSQALFRFATGRQELPKVDHLFGEQELIIYKVDETNASQDVVDQTYSLNRTNISLPIVPVADFQNQVKIVYDRHQSAIRVEFWQEDDKLGRKLLKAAHILKNVVLTTEGEAPFVSAPNFLLFSTDKGVKGIDSNIFFNSVFKAPIPSHYFAPSADIAVKGARITSMELLTPALEPRPLWNLEGQDITSEGSLANVDDLLLNVRLPDGSQQSVLLDYEEDVRQILAERMKLMLAQLQMIDREAWDTNVMAQILAEEEKDLQDFVEAQNIVVANAMESLGDQSQDSDLVRQSLAALARNIEVSDLARLLKRDPVTGRNAFEEVATSPRQRFGTSEEWTQMYERIQLFRSEFRDHLEIAQQDLRNHGVSEAAVKQLQLREPTWREILVGYALYPDSFAERSFAQIEDLKAEILKRKSERVFRAVKKFVTSKKLIALSLAMGGLFAFDKLNAWNDNAYYEAIFHSLSLFHGAVQDWPMVGDLTNKLAATFENAPGYTINTSFAVSRVFFGIATVMTFPFILVGLAKFIAGRKGHNWDGNQAFFTYGGRLYGKFNFPPQKWFWELVLNQKRVYTALKEGIPLLNPAVWNKPRASENELAEKDQELNSFIDSESVRNQRAILIAAAIVSQEQKIDPASLMMLLQSKQIDALSQLKELMAEGQLDAEWSEIMIRAYKALSELEDKGVGDLDQESIAHYYEKFSDLFDQFGRLKAFKNNHPKAAAAKLWISQKWRYWKATTSRKILPFVFFNQPGYEVFLKYKDFVVTSRNSDTAAHHFWGDYPASAIFYGLADPANFGSISLLSVNATVEVWANQLEQVFIYGVQGGIDATETNMGREGLVVAGAPLANAIISRDIDRKQRASQVTPNGAKFWEQTLSRTGHGRQQSVKEASVMVFKDLFDPESKHSVAATHVRRMLVALTGFQVRFLAGAVPRVLGLMLIAGVAGDSLMDSAFMGLDGIPRQINVMFNKLGVLLPYGFGTAAAFAIGYATIWSPVFYAMNLIKDKAALNRVALSEADALVVEGFRLHLRESLEEGIARYQALFETSDVDLPSKFQIEPSQFSDESALELFEFVQEKIPVPTIDSTKFKVLLNVGLGAVVSTLLFVSLSNAMYDPSVSIWPQLANSVLYFTGTLLTAMGVQSVGRKALAFTRDLFSRGPTEGGSSGGSFWRRQNRHLTDQDARMQVAHPDVESVEGVPSPDDGRMGDVTDTSHSGEATDPGKTNDDLGQQPSRFSAACKSTMKKVWEIFTQKNEPLARPPF